jgi:hypothetical protein
MDRLRLWRYKKLANNENVKPEEKVIDDEDYNSCFQLRKTLKVKIEILIFLHSSSLVSFTMRLQYALEIEKALEWN